MNIPHKVDHRVFYILLIWHARDITIVNIFQLLYSRLQNGLDM